MLTKKEKSQLLKAAKVIKPNYFIYSCIAIEWAGSKRLRNKYKKFYGAWKFSDMSEFTENRRILLILFFRQFG